MPMGRHSSPRGHRRRRLLTAAALAGVLAVLAAPAHTASASSTAAGGGTITGPLVMDGLGCYASSGGSGQGTLALSDVVAGPALQGTSPVPGWCPGVASVSPLAGSVSASGLGSATLFWSGTAVLAGNVVTETGAGTLQTTTASGQPLSIPVSYQGTALLDVPLGTWTLTFTVTPA